MPTTPKLQHRPTRLHLLNAGTRVFAEKGYAGAALREIAARAGVNSALIAFHFGSKEGLYRASLDLAGRWFRRALRSLPAAPAVRDPDARTRAALALRAQVRLYQRIGERSLGRPRPYGAREVHQALLALAVRAVLFPQPGTEGLLREALQPSLDHLARCLHALSPERDRGRVMRSAVRIHAKLVAQACQPAILALTPPEPRKAVCRRRVR